MNCILVLCLQLTAVCAAPWQLPLLPLQTQQLALQQQLYELQQLQVLKRLTAVNSPVGLNTLTPVIILLPDTQMSTIQNNNDRLKIVNEINTQTDSTHENNIEENDDSVIINAEQEFDDTVQPKRAILLLPNRGRLGIGDIISAIPFLPIEINVPDSIAWIYNGISAIISGIGQRFKPRPQIQDNNLRLLLKQQQMIQQNALPIVIVPIEIDAPIVQKKTFV